MAGEIYTPVGPSDDFSFDPFTADAQDLKRKYIEAMAQKLRASTMGADTPMWQVGRNLGADIGADLSLKDIEKQRKELVDRAKEMESRALESATPEIKALVQNPSTRKEGLALLQKGIQQRLDQQALDESGLMPPRGGALPGATAAASGWAPSYDQVLAASTSGNPVVAARAKALLESQYFKGQDPAHNVFRQPGGGYREDPVLTSAYLHGHPAPLETRVGPTGETEQVRRTDQPGVMPPPGAVAPPPGMPPPPMPQGGPPPGQIAFAGANGQPVGPGSGYTGYSDGTRQVSDERRLATLSQEAVQIQQELGRNKNPAAQATLQRELQSVQAEAADIVRRRGSAPPQAPQVASTQVSMPQAPMPQAPGVAMPPPIATYRPGSEPGATRTDVPAIEIWKKGQEVRQAASEKELGTATKVGNTEDSLDRMRRLNSDPAGVYTGMASSVGMGIENIIGGITGSKSATAVNTELFNKESADLRAAILKEYGSGNGISDADLKAASNRIPDASQDPRTRARMIENLQEDINGFKWQLPRIRSYTEGGMPLAEAQIRARTDYKAELAKQTQGQGGPQALPNAINAADNSMPGPTSVPPSATGAGTTGKAPPAAIEYLRAHPETRDVFLRKYGYLPSGI